MEMKVENGVEIWSIEIVKVIRSVENAIRAVPLVLALYQDR